MIQERELPVLGGIGLWWWVCSSSSGRRFAA